MHQMISKCNFLKKPRSLVKLIKLTRRLWSLLTSNKMFYRLVSKLMVVTD